MSKVSKPSVSITRMASKQAPNEAFAGRVSLTELTEAFHAPASGIFLLDPRKLRWVVRLHLGIRSVLAAVPHPECYSLPTGEFAECLQRYDIRHHEQIDWSRVPKPNVTLLAMPARGLRNKHNLSYFALRLWSACFHRAVAMQSQARRRDSQFNELLMRRCIQLIGAVRFEEIRDVLAGEQRLLDRSDDMEVLFEFGAYYLQLRYFSPLELHSLFPSLKGHDEGVENALELIGSDPDQALRSSRLPGTPSIQELVLSAKQGLRQRKYEDEKLLDAAHRARQVLAHPLLSAAIRQGARGEQLAIQNLVHRVTERLIQPGGIFGKLDFQSLRNLAVKLGLDLELGQLLIIDRVLGEMFGEQYSGSTRWQRLQLAFRSSHAIVEDRDSPLRRSVTRATLQRFLAILEQEHSRRASRLRQWLLYGLFGGWLIEWSARRLELSSPLAESVADRFRLARFRLNHENARRYQRKTNLARSMIAHRRAGRLLASVCNRTDLPEADQVTDQLNAAYQALISPFCDQLAGSFTLGPEPRKELERLIDYLVHRMSFHDHGVTSDLLLELERSNQKGQQTVRGFDLRGWLASLGRAPLTIELPHRGRIRRLEHLRRARSKAAQLPLPADVLDSYTAVIGQACHNAEREFRAALGPVLDEAFETIGFLPATPREQIAYLKLQRELQNEIVLRGDSHYSTLRDALSRNNLKLADWRIWDMFRGNHLTQLDRELGQRLPGTHHRGELYLKLFQLPTTLGFGTSIGRILVRALLLPFTAAATLMVLLQMGLAHVLPLPDLRDPRLLAILGFTLGLLIHVRPLRAALTLICWRPLRLLYRLLARGAVAAPRIVKSVLIYPGLGTAVSLPLLYLTRPLLFSNEPLLAGAPQYVTGTTLAAACCYLFWLLLSCTSIGVFVGGVVADCGNAMVEAIGQGLLLRLYYLIIGVSRATVRQLERLNYRVTSALRLVPGGGPLALKALGGLLWFPFYYVTRCYVLLFLEPQINPLKFPAVSISYKLILPCYVRIQQATITLFGLLLPRRSAIWVGGAFTFFSTGIFGFLFWELKENWKLYRSNARPQIHPIPVGAHGETIAAYLRLGFHSGTIPQLFRKRRQALVQAGESLRAARTLRQLSANHKRILDDLTHFVTYDLLLPLSRHELFDGQVEVGHHAVEITANTIAFSLTFTREGPPLALRLLMEEKNGVLIGSTEVTSGALEALSRKQQATLAYHLAVFYKLSAVDVLREEIEGYLASAYPNHSLDDPQAPSQMFYDVLATRLRVGFIEQDGHRSLGERVITALWPRPTQRMIPLKDDLRFGTRPLSWEDFNRIHEPSGHQLADEYLYLLRRRGSR